MTFTLKQLRYAQAVARTGHFGRAADQCSITQPALSQQIAALEAACGHALFERQARRIEATPFGLAFLAKAEAVLGATAALEDFCRTPDRDPDRPIRFGLIPTVAPYLLPTIFPALRDALPTLALQVSENRTEPLLAALADGTLDLALIGTDLPATGPRLAREKLFDDPFVLATDRHWRGTGPVDLATLDGQSILLLDEGHCLRDQTIAACRLADPARRTFAATSLATIVAFVANGQGVTLLPALAVPKESAGAAIVTRPLSGPGASRSLSLVWREATPFAAVYRQMADTIRAAYAALG